MTHCARRALSRKETRGYSVSRLLVVFVRRVMVVLLKTDSCDLTMSCGSSAALWWVGRRAVCVTGGRSSLRSCARKWGGDGRK